MRFLLSWLAAGAALALLSGCAQHSNSVVNLSHYDMAVPNFAAMRRDGIVGVIHEVTYPPNVVDAKYGARQAAATAAGLQWGAYHFANATDPVQQADFFLEAVASEYRQSSPRPRGVLLVLDFEKNGHYPGGTMNVAQAAAFVRRVKERTGRYPGLYSNEHRVNEVLGSPSVSAADRATLQQCWLWIANYHYNPKHTGPWKTWKMWQYTGDGICDLPRHSHPIHIANVRNAERNFYQGGRGDAASFWRREAWRPR